jgi:hypothetical protein
VPVLAAGQPQRWVRLEPGIAIAIAIAIATATARRATRTSSSIVKEVQNTSHRLESITAKRSTVHRSGYCPSFMCAQHVVRRRRGVALVVGRRTSAVGHTAGESERE